ncbi:unnamed protein product [Dimorphilus gyrociliatus]|uniref:Uncharacterized protein n=1 Tax=Dimorphilus gyrociliatus TaxID=2664684 RepID=A0A7I8V761_9ANNE|nr:unnamed protein product [Dimorphilus gyrociliatus]
MIKCHRNPCTKTIFFVNLLLLVFIGASFFSFNALKGDLDSLSQNNSTRSERDKGRTAIGVLALASVLTIVFLIWMVCLVLAGCVPTGTLSRSRASSISNVSNATTHTKGTPRGSKRRFSKRRGSNQSERRYYTLPKSFVSKYREEEENVEEISETSIGRTKRMDFRIM